MGRLEDRVVVVTGAARGLGQAIMGKLVAEGAQVVALGRDQASLDAAAAPFGESVTALAGDLGVAADVDRVFTEVESRFGRINALVNNAAIYDVFDLEEAGPDRIRRSLDANLLAPMLCIRKVTPLLRKAGGGDIINMSSESAVRPFNLLSAYGATKAGLEAFSRAIGAELKADRIRVSTLRLGPMRGTASTMSPEVMHRFMEKNAIALKTAAEGGMMELQSVAHVVTTLLTLPIDLACELIDLRPSGMRRD
jgi:NAD(P)-dependent dehydrogenase (short-subunit alcohol dehydrogenase family)